MNEALRLPTEMVELPSKGILYPSDNPLSSGTIEMKYMTAKEEDILTNMNYIREGTVIDKLLKSLIVSKINYDDLLVGDKNAIMVAARILGYGKDYKFKRVDAEGVEQEYVCDLSQLRNKVVDEKLFTPGLNEFSFTLPSSKNEVTFKILTHGDERRIEAELKGLQKINPKASAERTTRFKHIITSINGNREKAAIRDFVDNYLLAPDSKALRAHIGKITPDIDLKYYPEGVEEGIDIRLSVDFFWPSDES